MSSSTRQLPAVRLPPALSPTRDIQPSDRFELHWPRDPHASPPRAHPPPPPPPPPLSAADDADAGAGAYPWNEPEPPEPDATPTSDARQAPAPRLARAFSMPLPAQLGHLRHPRRDPAHVASPLLNGPADQAAHYNELSLELADSVQMVIQTLLQLSPPHLLDLAKEQFAACAVQIPTPSISAVLTSMKNLNYMSAHMPELSALDLDPPPSRSHDDVQADFDVGEMLQNVGDALSGVAAQAGVDLVLFHADVGMKHISVRGDECGLSYALSFIVRQVLQVCRPGETVELGLQILTAGSQTPSSTSDPDLSLSPPTHSPMLDATGPLDISFDIIHRFAPTPSDAWTTADGDPELYPPTPEQPFTADDAAAPATANAQQPPADDERAPPDFSALLLRRLLRHVGATLRTEQTPTSSKKHIATLALTLQRGAPLPEPPCLSAADAAARQPFPDLKLAQEPTLAELAAFTEQLRGKKVMFHANSSGSFARHLSGYLTSWGMDVSHVPTDDHEEKVAGMSVPLERAGSGSVRPDAHESQSGMESPHSAGPSTSSPTFVVIDDDAQVLRRRLLQLRAQAPYVQMKPKRQRPALAVHHRPRSTHSVRQYSSGLPQINEPEMQYQNVVIVHFTSLANYKAVKDMLQNTLSSPVGGVSNMPEVIVVPKPAGPRRFLTALYTAVNKPIVDPFFLPIATSPMSPGTQAMAPFFSGVPSSLRHRQGSTASNGSAGNVASGSGSNAGRSPRIGGEISLQPATPLAMDGIEYFSETAAKKVGGSPAAGVVIQSPDGRPAGIFFQPQPRLNRSGSQSSKAGSSGLRRMSNGRGERKALEDFGEAARDAVRSGSNVSQIPLDPSKLMRRTFNAPMSFGAIDTSDATSGEESSSGPMPPPPLRPVLGSSQGSSTVRQSRRSSASVLPHGHTLRATSPHAPGSPPSAPSDDSTIRVNLGRYTPQHSTPPLPPSPTAMADAAQALARGSLGRKSSVAAFTESPTTAKSPPTSPPSGSSSTPPVSLRKPTRKSAEGDVFTDATPSRPIRRGNNKAPIWRTGAQMDIVPPINVLVVEDNLINRTILSTALKKMGVKYGHASNGQEAIEKWRKGDFHLILMDIHMPVMDGITATREIRRLEAGPRPIPSPSMDAPHASESYLTLQPPGGGSPFRSSVIIVALTASNLDSDRIAALAAGCNDYIQKPVSLEWLRQKIMEWGSIKALQMWADVPAKFDAQQDQKALDIASQLKLPRSRTTSPDTRRPRVEERSVSRERDEPREQGESVSASSTRSASPAPSSSVAPVLALASASEESLAIPPTPEDERRPASPALVASSDTIPLHVHPPDDVGVDDTSFVPLDKTASGTPAAELPGGLPVELDSTTDSDAGLGARE